MKHCAFSFKWSESKEGMIEKVIRASEKKEIILEERAVSFVTVNLGWISTT